MYLCTETNCFSRYLVAGYWSFNVSLAKTNCIIYYQLCKFRWKPQIDVEAEERKKANHTWWHNERLRGFYRERQARENARREREQQQQQLQQQPKPHHPLHVHPFAEVRMNRSGEKFHTLSMQCKNQKSFLLTIPNFQ